MHSGPVAYNRIQNLDADQNENEDQNMWSGNNKDADQEAELRMYG